jgi:type II secretory pathway pseudopilin PulG
MLALAAVVVLLGVAVMLAISGSIIENRVNDRITEVNRDFDASLNRFRDDVRKELDARAPTLGAGAAVPTATPLATPTPAASPGGDATPTPTPPPTKTPSSGATPTATPTAEMGP